jgi:aldehyde dehydrogenase (NAD+)
MAEIADKTDMDRVFALQGAHRHVLRAAPARERIAKLRTLRAAVVGLQQEISLALATDFGKPPQAAASETFAVLEEIDHAVANLAYWMEPIEVMPGPHAASGTQARILHEPRGRVLIFGPWNFPFSLLMQPLVGAIAAGNACILKPSELTPATAALTARLIRSLFAESEVAIFTGGPDVASALLELPFDHIFFTGSTKVGKLVMAAAARHLASVTLELGGKSPAIIDSDADLAETAARIVRGKFVNAGQVCLSPDHVWVKRPQRDAFVAEFVAAIRSTFYRDGVFNQAAFARIIDDRNLRRLTGLIDDAVSRGARICCGGTVVEGRLEPTVLCDVPLDAAVMREEIFGPIMPILAYDDLGEVVDELNRRDKPLALYVFSRRPEVVEMILSRTSSGGVTVNDVIQHAAERNLPFGGVGPSGQGSYHGHYTFLAFSHQRSVYYKHPENASAEV